MAKLRRAAEKYRTRQPINGVMVTISVADLLSDSAEARAAGPARCANCLIELHEQLSIHFGLCAGDQNRPAQRLYGLFRQLRQSAARPDLGIHLPLRTLAAAGLQSERRFRTTIRPAATAHGRGAAGYAADGTRRAPARQITCSRRSSPRCARCWANTRNRCSRLQF